MQSIFEKSLWIINFSWKLVAAYKRRHPMSKHHGTWWRSHTRRHSWSYHARHSILWWKRMRDRRRRRMVSLWWVLVFRRQVSYRIGMWRRRSWGWTLFLLWLNLLPASTLSPTSHIYVNKAFCSLAAINTTEHKANTHRGILREYYFNNTFLVLLHIMYIK